MNELSAWVVANRVFFNPGKCKVLFHWLPSKIQIFLNENLLSCVNKIKYLAIALTKPRAQFERFNLLHHLKDLAKEIRRRGNLLKILQAFL
jgi:hypothetical protein